MAEIWEPNQEFGHEKGANCELAPEIEQVNGSSRRQGGPYAHLAFATMFAATARQLGEASFAPRRLGACIA